jgi:hypothetical protein
MTTSSSAVIFTSPRGVGPFNSPGWRVGTFAELAEGGTNGPFWIVREAESQAPLYLPLVDLDQDRVLGSIALVLAATTQDPNLEALLRDTHNLSASKSGKSFAPFWDLSDRDVDRIFQTLSNRIRLGVTFFEEQSLLTHQVCSRLKSKGLEVDVFRLVTNPDDSSPKFSS